MHIIAQSGSIRQHPACGGLCSNMGIVGCLHDILSLLAPGVGYWLSQLWGEEKFQATGLLLSKTVH